MEILQYFPDHNNSEDCQSTPCSSRRAIIVVEIIVDQD